MLTPNWSPDRRTLRQFAALWLLFLFALGFYRAWHGGGLDGDHPFGFEGPWRLPIVLWGLGLLAGAPGLIAPALIRPLYVGMMMVTFPIGWVVSHVLMAVVYFALFVPIAYVFRSIGRDRLKLRFDRDAKTYWTDRPAPRRPSDYFKLS